MEKNYLSNVTADVIYGNILISDKDRDATYQNFLLEIGIKNGSFPSLLYKFRNIDSRTLDIIKNKEFYFPSPIKFNDPFDCNLFYKREYNKEEILEYYNRFIYRYPTVKISQLKQKFGLNSEQFFIEHEKLNQKLVEESGIFSLSQECNNITMWSHYADNHKGLVFELEVIKDIDFFRLFGIVEYKTDYELLSYAKDNREELLKLFLTKYTDWEYEKEVRIIDYDKHGNRKFKKEAIKSIIFGYKASDDEIKEIIHLCKDNGFEHVKFKQAKLVLGKFALDFDDINEEDYLK